ncbi:MAG: NusG domain II-containing protein [Lachnospiraceae bacterium]|nr:NusG domain II-containing protein [Lachnospiraceae bacterium]
MKKADFRLILVVGVFCAAMLIGRRFFQTGGACVVVQVNGEVYGTYSLDTDQTVYINDTNVLVISGGKVFMSEADCPDSLCIRQGAISVSGTMIVCLPNRVVVQVVNGDSDGSTEEGYDAVVG